MNAFVFWNVTLKIQKISPMSCKGVRMELFIVLWARPGGKMHNPMLTHFHPNVFGNRDSYFSTVKFSIQKFKMERVFLPVLVSRRDLRA